MRNTDLPKMPGLGIYAGNIVFIRLIAQDETIFMAVFRKPRLVAFAGKGGAAVSVGIKINGKTGMMLAIARPGKPFERFFQPVFGNAVVEIALLGGDGAVAAADL